MKIYQVPLIYEMEETFVVRANSPEEAARIVMEKARNGEQSRAGDAGWQEPVRTGFINRIKGGATLIMGVCPYCARDYRDEGVKDAQLCTSDDCPFWDSRLDQ